MLNIKAEYENNMKLKEDIEKNGFASIDKSKYRVFVTTKKSDSTTNKNIIIQNKGLPRALKTIAWGEWFYGNYKALSTDKKVEKIEQIMKEWKKKVYDDNKEKATGKWTSSNEKDSRLDVILEEKSYYRLLCDAVALGRDGLGTGREKIPNIVVPLKIVEICWSETACEREILLMAIYYHYAPKDEDGYILLEKLDFEKWSNGTGGYAKILKKLSDEHIIEEILIGKEEMDEIVKVNIRENMKWKDNDSTDYMIEFIDNGERGMARQAQSAFEILDKIDPKMKSHFWEKVSKETKEKIRRFFVEVALNECNWSAKVEKRRWKMTHEQSKEKEELFKEATAEGLTNDNISAILVVDE